MPATDAFPIVFMFHYIYIHLAYPVALAARYALVPVNRQRDKRYAVEQ